MADGFDRLTATTLPVGMRVKQNVRSSSFPQKTLAHNVDQGRPTDGQKLAFSRGLTPTTCVENNLEVSSVLHGQLMRPGLAELSGQQEPGSELRER